MNLPPPRPGLPVTYDVRARRFITTEPITYTMGDHTVTVPAGFRSDLASIPRLLRLWTSRYELSIPAPILHDYLYDTHRESSWSRRDVDHLFLQVMEHEQVGAVRRRLAWAAVRLFGWLSWPPSKGQLRTGFTWVAHTMWQAAAAAVMFDRWWAIALTAGGLSAVKTALAPYGRQLTAQLTGYEVRS